MISWWWLPLVFVAGAFFWHRFMTRMMRIIGRDKVKARRVVENFSDSQLRSFKAAVDAEMMSRKSFYTEAEHETDG